MSRALRISMTAVFVMVLAAVAMLALARPGNKPGDEGDARIFELSGSVAPVYPLVDAVLSVKVENPNGFEIVVTDLTIVASDASEECTADNLLVTPVSQPILVPARGESTVDTPVRLVDDPADACQGATFPLAYRGTAMRP